MCFEQIELINDSMNNSFMNHSFMNQCYEQNVWKKYISFFIVVGSTYYYN